MANSTQIDPADRTPPETLSAIGENRKAYPNDGCIPCGAVIHLGFFFDGFGRHRDYDDKATSRYSNICRLWEAHRDNRDPRRKQELNQFWYPFYFSGLGTELNEDAADRTLVSAVLQKAGKAAANAVNDLPSKPLKLTKKLTGWDEAGLDLDPKSALTDATKEALQENSYRPIVKAFDNLVEEARTYPTRLGQVLKGARDGRWLARVRELPRESAKDVQKNIKQVLYDVRNNPLKVGWTVARQIFAGMADVVPAFRDNRVVARVLGTGVDIRVKAAKDQFEAAVLDVRKQIRKVQRIQVSVFGAERGCVLARAFINELTKEYKYPSDTKLRYLDTWDPNLTEIPIEIKFVGLLDAVSSLIEANELVGMLPLVGLVKQNYGDQQLSIPASVQRCVHFAAAHELRFYQRLDSLEKTRGVQYLYPGTSEDITGGAPPGTLGARAELQRVVLRDMLNEALSSGAAMDTMEDLRRLKPISYAKFTLAAPISDGKQSYRIGELMDAYREIVPHVARLNFLEHMQVFLRWMAVRYTSAEFRGTVTEQFDRLDAEHRTILKERDQAQAAYDELRNKWPAASLQALADAQKRLDAANTAEMKSTRVAALEKNRPSVGVWERIKTESDEMVARQSRQEGLLGSLDRVRDPAKGSVVPWGTDPSTSAAVIEERLMSPEQEALVRAWKLGASGRNPLPPKVMAFFDLLVHDTMLTSWHDHVLSATLYFQTRGVDTFGSSDYVQEEETRKKEEAKGTLRT